MSREGPYPCLQDARCHRLACLFAIRVPINYLCCRFYGEATTPEPSTVFSHVTISLLRGVNLGFVHTFTGGSMGQKAGAGSPKADLWK